MIIIASGQSNSLGRIEEGPFIRNENVFVYNNDGNTFEVADIENVRYRTVTGDIFGEGKSNPIVIFANRMQIETGRPVFVIIEARGASGIDHWIYGDYTYKLNRVTDQAIASREDLSYENIEYFVWLQGERS